MKKLIQKNEINEIQELLNKGLDQAELDKWLGYALQTKKLDISTLFLRHGGKSNSPKLLSSALIEASYQGNLEALDQLLNITNIKINTKDKEGNTAFMHAAENGHKCIIQRLIEIPKIDLNAKNKQGKTAFLLAVENDHSDLVTILLSKNTIIAKARKNEDDKTALLYAAENGHTDIVDRILSIKDIDVNFKNRNHETALILAAKNGHDRIVQRILEKNKMNIGDINGKALELAAENGHDLVVSQLLKANDIDVTSNNREYTIPNLDPQINQLLELLLGSSLNNIYKQSFILAAKNGHYKVVEKLLTAPGVNVNVGNFTEGTPLMVAAENGHYKVVEKLLTASEVDVNVENFTKGTPLIVAAKNGHYKVVEKLLADPRINVNIKNNNDQTALTVALQNDNNAIAGLLIERSGIDVNHKGNRYYSGDGALIIAIRKCNHEIVAKLLTAPGININIESNDGKNTLILALENEYYDIANMLIDHPEIDLNYQRRGDYRITPLMMVAEKGNQELVHKLISKEGINVNIKDKNCYNALMYAKASGHSDIVEILEPLTDIELTKEEAGIALIAAVKAEHHTIIDMLINMPEIDLNAKEHDTTALMYAIKSGQDNIAKLLLSQPTIDVNIKNMNTQNALTFAVENDNANIVAQLLSKKGIDINNENGYSRETALIIAIKKDYSEVTRLLLTHPEIDVNTRNGNPETPLVLAISKKDLDLVDRLLKFPNIDVNQTGGQTNEPPLIIALKNDCNDIVNKLLRRPEIDVNAHNRETALIIATEKGNDALVKQLLSKKDIDVNIKYYDYNALIYAKLNGHNEIAEQLEPLTAALTPEEAGKALIKSIKCGHNTIIPMLLELPNIDINTYINDLDGGTALTNAAERGNEDVVEQLLNKQGIDVNIYHEGKTALLIAVDRASVKYDKYKKIVQMLLNATGVNLNAETEFYRKTALMIAINAETDLMISKFYRKTDEERFSRNELTKQILLAPGVNINAKDRIGKTALMIAVENDEDEIIKMLLAREGIDANIKNEKNETALIIAANKQKDRLVQLLLKHPGIEKNLSLNEETNLMTAARILNSITFKKILKSEINQVNDQDTNGDTALIFASRRGHYNIVQQLLEIKHTNISLKNNNNLDALTSAIKNNRVAVVEKLLPRVPCTDNKYIHNKLYNKFNLDVLKYMMFSHKINSGNSNLSSYINKITPLAKQWQKSNNFLVKIHQVLARLQKALEAEKPQKSKNKNNKPIIVSRRDILEASMCGIDIPENFIEKHSGMSISKFRVVRELMRIAKFEKLKYDSNSSYIFIYMLMLRDNLNTIFADMPFDIKTNLLEFIVESDIKQVVTSMEAFHKSLLTPMANTNNGPAEDIAAESPTNS